MVLLCYISLICLYGLNFLIGYIIFNLRHAFTLLKYLLFTYFIYLLFLPHIFYRNTKNCPSFPQTIALFAFLPRRCQKTESHLCYLGISISPYSRYPLLPHQTSACSPYIHSSSWWSSSYIPACWQLRL